MNIWTHKRALPWMIQGTPTPRSYIAAEAIQLSGTTLFRLPYLRWQDLVLLKHWWADIGSNAIRREQAAVDAWVLLQHYKMDPAWEEWQVGILLTAVDRVVECWEDVGKRAWYQVLHILSFVL